MEVLIGRFGRNVGFITGRMDSITGGVGVITVRAGFITGRMGEPYKAEFHR